MATKINDKPGIRATLAARPNLKHVHLLEDGTHYFNKSHAEHMGRKKTEGEGEDAKEVLDETIVTLARDSDELKDEEAKPTETAKPAK